MDGPAAEMTVIKLTRATAYGVCLSQLAVLFCVIIYYPSVHVQQYIFHPYAWNGTCTPRAAANFDRDDFHSFRYSLTPLFALVGGVATFFSMTTAGLSERGIFEDKDFCHESLSECGVWDTLFWLFVIEVHFVVLAVAMSPADTYALLGACYLMINALLNVCMPMASERLSAAASHIYILQYCAGLGIAAYSLPVHHPNRMPLLCVIAFLDYILGLGHMWDRQPSMAVIANCRLFWTSVAAGVNIIVYAMWRAWFVQDSWALDSDD